MLTFAPESLLTITGIRKWTIEQLKDEEITVALDSGRAISFEGVKFRHIDHGYAVTSYSSQGQTVDRVLVNADTRSLISCSTSAWALWQFIVPEEPMVFTNSADQLRAALDRNVDKEMAIDALRQSQDRHPQVGVEWEHFLNNQYVTEEERFDHGNSNGDDRNNEGIFGEEVEFQLGF